MSGRGQYNHNQLSVDEYKCTHASRAKYTAATSKVELNTVRRKPKTLLHAMKRAPKRRDYYLDIVLEFGSARGGHVSSPIGTNYLWRYRWYYQLFAREEISCPDKELYQVIIIIQHKIIILTRLHAQFVDAMSKCANSHEEMLLTRLAGGALSAKQGRIALLEMEVFSKVSPHAAKMATSSL